MKPRILVLAAVIALGLGATAPAAHAQRTCKFAVPPSGASITVPLHPAYVTSIDLWENLKD